MTQRLKQPESSVSIWLHRFAKAVNSRKTSLSRHNQLIFLCGANRKKNVPSARREAIKAFIESREPSARTIYAELVLNDLTKLGFGHNTLDLEQDISDIADRIIIVLESPSAFCELGAFAHRLLRKKVIVVNDSHFKAEESFINTGPIAALKEVKSEVLWYPMSPDGVNVLDGIGATFSKLKAALSNFMPSGSTIVSEDLTDLKATKNCLYFVHDLVVLFGPITHKELVAIMVHGFGKKPYDMLKKLLGILRAAELIHSREVAGEWIYHAAATESILGYNIKTTPLMAVYRRLHLRFSPSRFSSG